MTAESISLLIDDANQFESSLRSFLVKLQGNVDESTYERIEEQVKEIRKALWEFKDLLLNLEFKIQ